MDSFTEIKTFFVHSYTRDICEKYEYVLVRVVNRSHRPLHKRTSNFRFQILDYTIGSFATVNHDHLKQSIINFNPMNECYVVRW